MSGKKKVARVEDVDESGNVIEGTDRYAESVYDPSVASPSKEREIPNTSRTRRDKARRDSISPGTSGLTDSDSTLHPRRDSLRSSRDHPERRLSTRDNKNAMVHSNMRPPVKHAKTAPSVPKEASYYGVTPPTLTPSSSSRPRAHTSRPQSVYTASRPPAANTRWYQNQAPPQLQQLPVGSYPLPSWGGGMPYPIPPPSPSPVVSQSPVDYFSSRPLEARFGNSAPRPQSSIGFRPPTRPVPFDDYGEPEERRPHRIQPRYDERRGSMAPPPRPASARPVSLAIRPPPGNPTRQVFDEDDFAGESDMYRDISPRTHEYPPPMPRRRSQSRRRPSSSIYDDGHYRTEVAVAKPIPNGRASRRASYYGQSSSSGSFEDKLHQATQYQDEIAGGTGGTGMQLTAERLRKAARHGGSRSSTRSSGSRDESGFGQSATTRTTRSSAAGEEDMTIRVKGNAVLEVGGAKMRCQDGTEINISRGPPPATGFRTSSDQSSYLGQEDRRSRMERPTTRNRASSQAAPPFSRAIPQYEDNGGHYPPPSSRYEAPSRYETPSRYEVPPPYPAYPSVFPSRPF